MSFFWGSLVFLGVACVFFIVRKQQSRTRGLLVGPMHSPLLIPKPIPIPLHMHMLIYIYTCTYTCICICVHIHTHTHIPIHIHIHIHIHIYETLKGVKPDRNPNERKPIMKTEYTQPNTLKDAKASLKESRNPKNDETQAEALKRVSKE